MSSEFHFGLGRGKLGRRAAAIARRHGARLVNYEEPNGSVRHWFATENLGAPFDGAVAAAVLTDLVNAGIDVG